jgi:hypothetical protein
MRKIIIKEGRNLMGRIVIHSEYIVDYTKFDGKDREVANVISLGACLKRGRLKRTI